MMVSRTPKLELAAGVIFAVALLVVPLLPGGKASATDIVVASCVGAIPVLCLLLRGAYSIRHPEAVAAVHPDAADH